MRILIVEDEQRLAENVARSLRESAGYAVDVCLDGEDGLYMAQTNPYDLVLLDLMIPKIDGLTLLKQLRDGGGDVPVLVLTARDEKESIVALLNAGADDYVAKPFDLGELLARAKALIRRGKGHSSAVLKIGDIEINTADLSVQCKGKPVMLTAMEYRVLEYLAHRPGAVVSKTELLEHLYDFNWERFSNVIEVYISGLRRKLEDGGESTSTPCADRATCCAPDMANISIQRRLVAVIAISQLLLAVGLIDVAVFVTRAQLRRAFDVALEGRAMSIAALVRYSEDTPHRLVFANDLVPPPLEKGSPDVFEVYANPHVLIARSPNWPEKDAVLPPRGYRWIATYSIQGVPYRKLKLEHVPVLDREGDEPANDFLTVTYAAPIDPVLSAVSDVLLYIVIGSVVLLATSVGFSLWALRRSLRPLSALADSARQVSPHNWQLHLPTEAREVYELAPLTEAMTAMLDDLHQAFTQQREFLANAAHELKTPVAMLKSTLQSLLQRPREADEYRAGLGEALDDMARLEKLLHSMLRLARAEQWAAGNLRRDLPSTDIGLTCQLAMERLQPLAAQRGVTIDFAPNGTARMAADPDDLELVWANLLENAIRFSPEGGTVRLGMRDEHARCRIQVTDNGPGIPSSQLPHIFERFHRGDASRARTTGGYGLGLAISKALVEAYGGTIEAQSGNGSGTRMVVSLPTHG